MPTSRRRLSLAVFAAALVFALVAAPVTRAAADAGGDPGVARISVLHGSVDLKRADSGDSMAAAINAPVSVGDYLSTQNDARAEVQFEYGAALRIAAGTQLRFTRLEPQHHELQLAQGTVELRVLRGLEGHPEIDTPQGTVRPLGSGRYRISVADDGSTTLTVRSGTADMVTNAGTRTVDAGSALLATGESNAVRFHAADVAQSDAFDRWNDQRDAYAARAQTNAYVDAGVVGADDLDGYGTWTNNASYGDVWVPRQGPDWAPYRDGRWNWQPYYGWTWIGAEPWGWAPYHYGNWFYNAGSGWCWAPGAFGQPFAYRPALVSFFSFGGLSVGFGNIVGWVPLAPFETYRPWYGQGFYNGATVVNNVTNNYNTITNITTVPNPRIGNSIHDLRNLNAPGGAVAVGAASFAAGDFKHIISVSHARLSEAAPVNSILPIVPTKANLAFTGAAPSSTSDNKITVTRFAHFAEPTGVRSFATQQSEVTSLVRRSYPGAAAALKDQGVTPRIESVRPSMRAVPVDSHGATRRDVKPAAQDGVHQPVQPRVHATAQRNTGHATPTTQGGAPHSSRPVEVLNLNEAGAESVTHGASPWDRFTSRAIPTSLSARSSGTGNGSSAASHTVTSGRTFEHHADPFARFSGTRGADVLPRRNAESESRPARPYEARAPRALRESGNVRGASASESGGMRDGGMRDGGMRDGGMRDAGVPMQHETLPAAHERVQNGGEAGRAPLSPPLSPAAGASNGSPHRH